MDALNLSSQAARAATAALVALCLGGSTAASATEGPIESGATKVSLSLGRGLSLAGINPGADTLGTRVGVTGLGNFVPFVTYDYMQLQLQEEKDRVTINNHVVGLGGRYYVRARGPDQVSAYLAGGAFLTIPKLKDSFGGNADEIGEDSSNLGGFAGFGGEYLFAPGFGVVGEAGVHRWMLKSEANDYLLGAAVTTTYSYMGMVFYF
jgi:hypothetical protein